MAIAFTPSTVTMPVVDKPYPSLLAFLIARFPRVAGETWEQRLADGKVIGEDGLPLGLHTAYTPHRKIFYFRERDQEPVIPFTETIIFQNEELLVVCKPHFLPVIPSGPYVNECLLARLQKKTGNPDLAPIHRIDRETAGLVLFSAQKGNRDLYHDLFRRGAIKKTYLALCHYPHDQPQRQWLLANRIEKGTPWFRMQATSGASNAHTAITLLEVVNSQDCAGLPNRGRGGQELQGVPAGAGRGGEDRALFQLRPLTGKKHQLRLHLSSLGFGIINDRYYPELQPEQADDFTKPLQLLAQSLQFQDPLSGQEMEFHSERRLAW